MFVVQRESKIIGIMSKRVDGSLWGMIKPKSMRQRTLFPNPLFLIWIQSVGKVGTNAGRAFSSLVYALSMLYSLSQRATLLIMSPNSLNASSKGLWEAFRPGVNTWGYDNDWLQGPLSGMGPEGWLPVTLRVNGRFPRVKSPKGSKYLPWENGFPNFLWGNFQQRTLSPPFGKANLLSSNNVLGV